MLKNAILANFWQPGWPESESAYRKAPEKWVQINISTKFRKIYVFDMFNGFSDNSLKSAFEPIFLELFDTLIPIPATPAAKNNLK